MLDKTELAERLKRVNVKAVSEAAGVSEKTVYRLRNLQTNPSYETTRRLIGACRELTKKKARPTRSRAQRDAKGVA